jgi:hypothetical protein
MTTETDDPAVKAEVEAAFAAYEAALVGNSRKPHRLQRPGDPQRPVLAPRRRDDLHADRQPGRDRRSRREGRGGGRVRGLRGGAGRQRRRDPRSPVRASPAGERARRKARIASMPYRFSPPPYRMVRGSSQNRALSRTVITTHGHDFATAMTLFHRDGSSGAVGRQRPQPGPGRRGHVPAPSGSGITLTWAATTFQPSGKRGGRGRARGRGVAHRRACRRRGAAGRPGRRGVRRPDRVERLQPRKKRLAGRRRMGPGQGLVEVVVGVGRH